VVRSGFRKQRNGAIHVLKSSRLLSVHHQAGLRNKSTYNPTQYSVEWANVVTTYLKKQLAEIGLPSPPRPGINIKMTFKGVLSDSESRERWVGRFSYRCAHRCKPRIRG
jgi:mediator of RNA polymerase II transcription subunit 12